MSQRSKTLRDIITVATTAVLFAVILCLVVFAAKGYQHASGLQDDNGNTRAVLSYIVSSVRDSGSSEIGIEDRSGRECLIIHGDGYEQRFYLDDGMLLEEYTEPDAAPEPDTALAIGRTDTLGFEMGDDGILTIMTDSGSASVNTRRRR